MAIYLRGLMMGLAYVAPIGSLIVIFMGIGLIRSKSGLAGDADTGIPLLKTAAIAFTVTWINPQALIDGTMLLGAASATLTAGEKLPFVIGFTSASVIWFFGVTTAISLFSGKITDKLLRIINIICGAVMVFYGLRLVYSFIQLMGWA